MDTDERTYTVSGMSCGHCAAAVRGEVQRVVGVSDVEVDLPTGSLTVRGRFGEEDIRAAVAQAGYELAAR